MAHNRKEKKTGRENGCDVDGSFVILSLKNFSALHWKVFNIRSHKEPLYTHKVRWRMVINRGADTKRHNCIFRQSLQARRLVPTPTVVREWLPRSRWSEEGKTLEYSTSIWLMRWGSTALSKNKVTFAPHARSQPPREGWFYESILWTHVCFILENKNGLLDLIMAFCFKDCNASFWYGAFHAFFYEGILLCASLGRSCRFWCCWDLESDVENQTKNLSASGVRWILNFIRVK